MSSKKKQIYDIIYDFTFEQLEQEQIHLFSEKLQNLVDAAIPAELYKYRPPEEKHINSFESDDIYLNFPTAYNDPTDCVLFYSKSILLELQAIINSDEMDDEDRDSLQLIVESIRDANSAIDLAAYIPSSIKVACFSENIQSPLMWSHYADEHKGFALGYDFRNACIKECTQCLIGRSPTEHMRPIYPVVYKQKRTDMTAYLLNMIRAKKQGLLTNGVPYSYIPFIEKGKDWKYEQEWRIICENPELKKMHFAPNALYLGSRMQDDVRERLIEIAKEKGIKVFETRIDFEDPSFQMNIRSID